jgi:oxalate decarboxylase/phosphoglucose isomerase-like protein (cupin superfamily)
MYVLKGAIDYFYRDADTGEIKYLRVETGQNVFTPPKELHATYFPEETVLVVSSKFPRDQETYEKDTVREPLVTSENVAELLSKYGA